MFHVACVDGGHCLSFISAHSLMEHRTIFCDVDQQASSSTTAALTVIFSFHNIILFFELLWLWCDRSIACFFSLPSWLSLSFLKFKFPRISKFDFCFFFSLFVKRDLFPLLNTKNSRRFPPLFIYRMAQIPFNSRPNFSP